VKIHLYEINYSYDRKGSTSGWRANGTYSVLTTSIVRAIELFYEKQFLNADIHNVQKRDRHENIDFDPWILEEADATDHTVSVSERDD
jgi:hypothetical protein